MNKNLIAIFGGLILASVLFLGNSFAYSPQTTHPDLTREIIDFYELSSGKKLTDEQKQWIIQGSIDEDAAPRWLNHFYDPVFDRGLDTSWPLVNGYSAKNWGLYSKYQLAKLGQTGTAEIIIAGKSDPSSLPFVFSYEAGLERYARSKEKDAYITLGHILHLIEDLTVPEHTRNDAHPGLNNSSFYEEWTKNNSAGLTQNLAKRLFVKGNKPVIYADLESYFNNLSTYTNNYFFSPRTINSEIYLQPKIVFEDGTFAYGKDENGEFFDLATFLADRNSDKKVYYIDNPQILQEYWLRLSRQAVINGAGVIELFLSQAEVAKQKADSQQVAQKSSLISQIWNFFRSPSAPKSEPALVINSESAKPLPKIVKTETITKPVAVQKPAPSAPAQPKAAPSVITPKSTPSPTPITTPVPVPAPQNKAPQSAAPMIYGSGGGGSTPPATSGGGGGSSSNTTQQTTQQDNSTSNNATTTESLNVQTFNTGDLVINEIMYDLEGSDTLNSKSREWIELYNKSSREIDLTGWKFNDGDDATNHTLYVPPDHGGQGSIILPVNGYAILAEHAETFLIDHPGFSGTVIDVSAMNLKDASSTVTTLKIITPDVATIDEVTYYNSWGANGNGRTLERKSTTGGSNDAANWAQSSAPGGTPGAANNWEITATSSPQTATSTPETATSSPSLLSLGTDVSATTTITANTTWTLAGSPYRLFFDGTKKPIVAAGAVLTIEPGVKIIPQGGNYTALEIQGTLSAIATSGAPIIFTSIADADNNASTTPQKGDWLNITFTQGSQANLDYVEFRYGGQGLERPLKEMIKAIGATVNINHSIFTNSQSIALRFVDSNGMIENSTFSDNNCGISVDSLVNGDGTTDGGCAGASGYFPAAATTMPQIRTNQFVRNHLIAVEIRNGASPILDGNLFTDNGYPIRIESSYPIVTNSQIANSTTSANILKGIAIDGYTHFRKDYTLKNNPQLPYILETNGSSLSPYIDAGATLTIEPGAIFKTGHTFTALNVNGNLIASTTLDNPIVFTSLKDDARGGDTNGDGLASSPQDNDWAHIKFLTGSIGNFVNAIFSYGGYGFIPPVSLPATTTQLLVDLATASDSWNQWGWNLRTAIDTDNFTPDHNGNFEKIVIHNFAAYPGSNSTLSLDIKNSGDVSVASASISTPSVIFDAKTELPINLSGTFVAGETFKTHITWTNAPSGIGSAVTVSLSGNVSAAFYELISPAAVNPALSIDSGATVIVQ